MSYDENQVILNFNLALKKYLELKPLMDHPYPNVDEASNFNIQKQRLIFLGERLEQIASLHTEPNKWPSGLNVALASYREIKESLQQDKPKNEVGGFFIE